MRSSPATCLLAEVVHHEVAVAFEQRHERLHLAEHAALLGRRDERDEAAFVERVLPAADRLDRVRQRACERARVGVDELEHLVHERQEVVAHPRNADELRAVGDLVDRDPQPEVARAGTRTASQGRARWRRRSRRLRRGRRGRAGRTGRAPAARRIRAARRARSPRPAGRSARTDCAPCARRTAASADRAGCASTRGSSRPTRADRAPPRARDPADAGRCARRRAPRRRRSARRSRRRAKRRGTSRRADRVRRRRARRVRAVAQSTGSGPRTDGRGSVTTRAALGFQPPDLHRSSRAPTTIRMPAEPEHEQRRDPVEPELPAAVVDEARRCRARHRPWRTRTPQRRAA